MQLLEVQSSAGRRFYVDGKRATRDRINDLKATHDQDSFRTECRGDVTRQYSSLRKR